MSIAASDPSVAASNRSVSAFRSPSPADGNDRHEASSPFAMLLDATAAASEPPAPPRNDRTETRSDRHDDAPVADDRRAEAEPPVKDAKDGKARDVKDDNEADKIDDVKPETKDAASATAKADALADAMPTADASPDTTAAAPVAPAQPAAPTEAEAALAPEAAEIAPLAAAPEAPRADGAEDPHAEADAAGTAKPRHAAHADTGPIKPAVEPGKDDGSQGKGENAANHRRHAAEERAPTTSGEPAARADAATAVKTTAETLQLLSLPTQPIHASAPTPTTTGPASVAAAVSLAGLAVEIAAQAHAGKNRFEIRLDPPELGRIDVRLDVDRDGNVSSRLVVERADTLDLLRRDASQLERALQQAGLKTGDNALEFSLRDQNLARDNGAQDGARSLLADEDAVPLEALRQGYGRLLGLGGGIDIRV